jgi:malate dehydrogenase
MFAARRTVNLFQKRAFSASAINVCVICSLHLYSLANSLAQASKVAVLGAAGGIGQPLSLLLKLNPRVSELALYDIRGGPGMIMMIRLN